MSHFHYRILKPNHSSKCLSIGKKSILKKDEIVAFYINQSSIKPFFLGERASVIKRDDNLHPEGEFQKRPDKTWAPGERANVIKRDDNLHPEGEFHKRPDQKWAPGKKL